MTDDELITAVRQPFTTVRMNTPVDQIVSRGRAVRARHRIPWMAGTLAVAAGLAVALTALLPAHHQPPTPPTPRAGARPAGGNIPAPLPAFPYPPPPPPHPPPTRSPDTPT